MNGLRRSWPVAGLLISALGCAGSEGAGPRPLVGPGTAAPADDRPRLIVRDGFVPGFSPDGRQLAYSRTPENSGIAVLDLHTGTTRVVTTTGKVPSWSPDGRWIAYVVGPPDKGFDAEQVWMVAADGSGARKLADSAGYPSWTADGRGVVVQARSQKQVLVIGLENAAAPAVYYDGPTSPFPGVRRDGAQLVFSADNRLQVVDRASKKEVFSWPTPGVSGLFAAWSNDGRRLAFSGNPVNPVGVWVIDLDKGRAVQLAVGHYMRPVWSADDQSVAFDLRTPKRRAIWRMGRGFVEKCLEQAAIAPSEIGLGAGICPDALRPPPEI
jgi:Tol biopolymer transport system component